MSVDTRSPESVRSAPRRVRPIAILAVVLVAVLTINVETTIVNVALPTLIRRSSAPTTKAAAVDRRRLQPGLRRARAAGGSLGDRFGRRGTLLVGLPCWRFSGFGGSVLTPAQLIAVRAGHGRRRGVDLPDHAGDYPDTFRDPTERADAIGSGAVAGWASPSARSPAASCSSTSGGAASSSRWRRSRWSPLWQERWCADVRTTHRTGLDSGPALPCRVMLGASSTRSSRRPRAVGQRAAPRRLRCAVGRRRWRSSGGSAARRPADRRQPVRQPAIQRGQRRGDGRVLRPVRVHLPDHPVLPALAGLRRRWRPGCASCRWRCPSPSDRSSVPGWR